MQNTSLMRQKLNLIAVSLVSLTIMFFSLTSPSGTGTGSVNSYILHMIAYFVLAAALMIYFHDTRRGHLEAVFLATAFGFAIEIMQMGLDYRVFGYADAASNLLGASLILLDHRSKVIGKIVRFEDHLIERTFSDLF